MGTGRALVALAAGAALAAACAAEASSGDGAATTVSVAATEAPTTLIPQSTVATSTSTTLADLPTRDGVETLHLSAGPFHIEPGQNNIDNEFGIPQPEVDGWIVGFRPNLTYLDGTVPRVDIVHLHHGVWLNQSARDATSAFPERFFAAGEEKTLLALPEPYAYPYHASDRWFLNYMLHNLSPTATDVLVTYDIDFVPADSPAAEGMIAARPVWMDVQNGKGYPVFDVLRGDGDGVTYTYPDQAADPYPGEPRLNEWTVDQDGVLIATAAHLHPGGLHGDLWLDRGAETAHLFRSEAKYYEPAGAVSWDVSMTATLPDWRVEVHQGDVLRTNATYDSGLASWYESMGIMVVWMGPPLDGAADPFTTGVDTPGMLTHGHLPENDNHGGDPDPRYLDLTALPSEPVDGTIEIFDWVYGQGDMNYAVRVPTVRPGETITFLNLDADVANGQWHTITACKAPCNLSTGIAYPLADGPVIFDSGELGTGGPPTADTVEWTIPSDLPPDTYTYFCRIHPLMRGAFRVEEPEDG